MCATDVYLIVTVSELILMILGFVPAADKLLSFHLLMEKIGGIIIVSGAADQLVEILRVDTADCTLLTTEH